MTERVNSLEGFSQLDNNLLLGCLPSRMDDSQIIFKGVGNILYIEDGVSLRKSRLVFQGDNGVAYLSSSKHPLNLNVSIYNDSTFYIGSNSYTNPGAPLSAIASERQFIYIGKDALLSLGIWMRTADPHLVFSCDTLERVNPSKSIVIGDHVWVGQEALLLKGTVVGSGSIIAARSVCANKIIPSNTSWGGNPARQIGERVFFSKQSAHTFTAEQSTRSAKFKKRDYIYHPNKTGGQIANELNRALAGEQSPRNRVSFLVTSSNHEHDQFAVLSPTSNSRSMRRGPLGKLLDSFSDRL